ncbi:MAG: nicotinamide-nucleotide amidohydrolase family protein, partial [Bradymonadaceae bacterium]
KSTLFGVLSGMNVRTANYPGVTIEKKVGAWLVGRDDERLYARLGRRLLEAGATVSVAESCTAGSLGAALTEISGSSAWFERGYITYANEAKIEELGVMPGVLETFGAVSPETVCQMALGARKRARSTFALAISGIAGPGGGTPEKPVGTVHLAMATPQGVYHQELGLRRFNRSRIRQASVFAALALLLWHLDGKLRLHDVHGPLSDEDVRQGHIPKQSKG